MGDNGFFFPNFSRWMGEASQAFFAAQGVPPWRELVKSRNIIGTPLLETHTSSRPATYGETVLCEGTGVRAFCIRDPGGPGRIKAIPAPKDIKALCT
ncbi:hypothetical protein [Roseateles sp.]|uniref:hypothetical protein n=1 Tax=Roseateles sp. TaxID=1971397 RepID=UPI003266490A